MIFAGVFFMQTSSAEQVHYAKGLKRDAKLGIFYANFIEHKHHYLNVSQIGSALVSTFFDCSVACIKTVSCFSFNLAASPDIDGKLWCELLATDKYNASDKFHASQFFHHYSIYVSFFYFFVEVSVENNHCCNRHICETYIYIFKSRQFLERRM